MSAPGSSTSMDVPVYSAHSSNGQESLIALVVFVQHTRADDQCKEATALEGAHTLSDWPRPPSSSRPLALRPLSATSVQQGRHR